jgi:hypothetical protein
MKNLKNATKGAKTIHGENGYNILAPKSGG